MKNKDFENAYKKLNTAQKKAVDSIEGPVMVIAGPGTGKTRILTLRIANILKQTDTAPENILALTFTESGVYSMRKSLTNIIGSTAYRVHIYTFHGFCNEIIKNYPESFPQIIGSVHIDITQQIKILESVIENSKFEFLKPSGDNFFYLYPALKKISELKRDGISPADLKKKLTEISAILKKERKKTGSFIKKSRNHKKGKELLKLYIAYQEELVKNKFYDYDDMIVEVVNRLSSDSDLLLEVQEQYQYVLADEHQDVNKAQNKVLELLSSFHAPAPNLCIVGDEKQAIFRFQGASLENFHYFRALYKNALLIDLRINYRSSQQILDAAHDLIRKGRRIDKRTPTKLTSVSKGASKKLQVCEFSNIETELKFIAQDIKNKINSGVLPEEIAVLYRDNNDAFPISDIFDQYNIPYIIESDENILEDEHIRKIIIILETIHEFGNDALLIQALHIDFLGIDNLDIHIMNNYARDKRKSLFWVLKNLSKIKDIDVQNKKKLIDVYKKFSSWSICASNKHFLELLDRVVSESGYIKFILKEKNAALRLQDLSDIYKNRVGEKADKFYTLADFMEYLYLLRRYKLRIRRNRGADYIESVRLMTAHRSKGLEFDSVYITGVLDKHWGNRRSREYFPLGISSKEDELDDERRLFYVALTRAKKHVHITYARQDMSGSQKLPSIFIHEIDSSLVTSVNTKKIEETLSSKSDTTKTKKMKNLITDKERAYYVEIYKRQGLSVTALNNYLECPWRYFYRNLIRIPYNRSNPQLYGIAIHASLKRFFDSLRKTQYNATKLIQYFNEELDLLPFSESEREVYRKKGKESLSGYHKKYSSLWGDETINEYHVRGVILDTDTTLSGVLDKIEFTKDGYAMVTDYKTGKPKTRNAILGKTKSSNGDYFRQLVFYKLLLELHNPEKYKVDNGIIDFLEPDEKGRWHTESFKISDSDVGVLRSEILRISSEILQLSFFDKGCGKKECEYCRLRSITSIA